MRSLALLLCLLPISCICAQSGPRHAAIKQTRPPDRKPQYFPVGLFSQYPELSEWITRWYASELRALEEPSLHRWETRRGAAVYRFLLIPSFSPSLAVRLMVNPDGTGILVAKSTANSSKEGKAILRQETVAVSVEQVDQFLSLLREADFWSLPSAKTQLGFDGEEWLMEAKRSGKYHVVDRWSGAMDADYSRACRYLQELSPVKAEKRRRLAHQEWTPSPK